MITTKCWLSISINPSTFTSSYNSMRKSVPLSSIYLVMHLFISVWTYFIQWTITGFWRRKWQPTPVFLPEKPHGRRSLVGYSPRGREESDTTERLHFPVSLSCIGEGNGNPLQYSCLENPMDGGAWWATVHGVAKSQTRPSTHACKNSNYKVS